MSKHFTADSSLLSRPAAPLAAVNEVSLALHERESLGLVGESGCGKSTLARLVMGLLQPSRGAIHFAGQEITGLSTAAMRPLRKRMQIIFQDPYASLDPRMTIADSITEPLLNGQQPSRQARRTRALELLEAVGMGADDLDRYPHQFSGGQRQRIGIARALSVAPDLIVADEPLSALDVSIQAQILNLLKGLQQQLGMACLFISHDMAVVEYFCDRIAVMYAGRLVEIAAADNFHRRCRHPYSRELVAAVPQPDPAANVYTAATDGEPPNPADLPPGCSYHPRCAYRQTRCRQELPPLETLGGNHQLACWHNDGQGMQGELS